MNNTYCGVAPSTQKNGRGSKEATAEWIDDNPAETKNMETFGK